VDALGQAALSPARAVLDHEVLVAFFLEATFLSLPLFGWERAPPWRPTLSAIAVAVSTLLSALWILSANSWMQTPAGYEMRDGIAYLLDWLAIAFNPSFPYSLANMATAAYLTTPFVVLAVGARYLLAGRYVEQGRTMIRVAVGFAAIVAPPAALDRRPHGLNRSSGHQSSDARFSSKG
jgi:cytochrome d ubiquinol oxidase subunit I